MPSSESAATVTLPREIVEVLVKAWPLCGVCTGASPAWDGHDANPPCIGYAKRVAVEALSAK
jgi:hypothetical protein